MTLLSLTDLVVEPVDHVGSDEGVLDSDLEPQPVAHLQPGVCKVNKWMEVSVNCRWRQEPDLWFLVAQSTTDLPAYSDTVYSDTPLTVTVLTVPN